jgi:hypothetical protein
MPPLVTSHETVQLLLLVLVLVRHIALNVVAGWRCDSCMVTGWAASHSTAHQLMPLLSGASGPEFDWMYLRAGVHSNLDLVWRT